MNEFENLINSIFKELLSQCLSIQIIHTDTTITFTVNKEFPESVRLKLTALLDDYGADYSFGNNSLRIAEI